MKRALIGDDNIVSNVIVIDGKTPEMKGSIDLPDDAPCGPGMAWNGDRKQPGFADIERAGVAEEAQAVGLDARESVTLADGKTEEVTVCENYWCQQRSPK